MNDDELGGLIADMPLVPHSPAPEPEYVDWRHGHHDWQEGNYLIALQNDPYSDPRTVPVDVCSVCGVLRLRRAGSVYPKTGEAD